MYISMPPSTTTASFFLHSIQPGPASKSYGLQVAGLAGVPPAVLDAAKAKLNELETIANQGQTIDHATPPPAQRSVHPVIEQLAELDVDGLTPKQALEWLYTLRGKT